MRQWAEQTRTGLEEREERVRERENAACRRERTLVRDEKLAALQYSIAEGKLAEAKRRETSPASPLVRYRTIIPMRIEQFDLGDSMTSTLHTPVFCVETPVGDEETGSASQASAPQAGPRRHRSAVDEQMATMVHDEVAQRKILVSWDHVEPGNVRRLKPRSKPQPEQRPKPRPEQRSADGFDDDSPPF